MNVHNPELKRQMLNYIEVRHRLWNTKPKPKEPVHEPPLWTKKRIYFDAHVRQYQWEKAKRQDPQAAVRRRCEFFRIPYAVMVGAGARREVAHRRHLLWWELIQDFGMSYPQVGRMFGRDHTTVLHGYRKIDAMSEGERASLDTPVPIKPARVRL